MVEKWHPVTGYEGQYAVSDQGRVRSFHRSGRILAPRYDRFGYVKAVLCNNGARKQRLVHRLVAEAFMDAPPSPAHEINHIDGDKANNRVSNLEWATRSENGLHAYRNGLSTPRRGSTHGRATLSEEQVAEIKSLSEKMTQRAIAERFGVRQPQIYRIIAGLRWSHVG